MARKRREWPDELARGDLAELALVEFHADEVRIPVSVDGDGAFHRGTGALSGRRITVAYSHTGLKLCEMDPETGFTDMRPLRGRSVLAHAGRRGDGGVEWRLTGIRRGMSGGRLEVLGSRPASEREAELLDSLYPGCLDAWV